MFMYSFEVILIFGIFGTLRYKDIVNLTIQNIKDTNHNEYIVKIEDMKNDYLKFFVIRRDYYDMVKKYINFRPTNMSCNIFYTNYQNGICTRQLIGINKVRETQKVIALYLNLDNPELFTGHSFRRSAATALSNLGANLMMVKQLGGWRSDTVESGYIENSMANRKAIFNSIIKLNQIPVDDSGATLKNQSKLQVFH